jgi:HD-GYP domain-containing protein (c-di-GMP phosphodiesterase class II)
VTARTAIDIGARIFTIADSVDAMTQDRVYRKAHSMDWARDEVLRCRETHFAPDAVDAFLSLTGSELGTVQAIRAAAGIDMLGADADCQRSLASVGLGHGSQRATAIADGMG